MGQKVKDRATQAEYVTLRMEIALKRMHVCETDAEWIRAGKWVTAWDMARTTIRKRPRLPAKPVAPSWNCGPLATLWLSHRREKP